MVNLSPPWDKSIVRINEKQWEPGAIVVMNPEQINKVEVEVPEESLQTLRFNVADNDFLEPGAVPGWGKDIQREAGKFTLLVTFTGESTGFIKLIIYSRDVVTILEIACEVNKNEPSLRFYYANASQYAPLPPEVVNLRVNNWYGVDIKLTYSDGSPIQNAPATIYRPEKEPVKGHTNIRGVMLGFPAYQYTTPGLRTFEAVATLPSGEVRATYLVDVQS